MTRVSEESGAPAIESVARRRVAALGVVLVSVYGPMFAWLLFLSEAWSNRLWSSLGMILVLPGLIPGSLLAGTFQKSPDSLPYLSGGCTLLLLLGSWHLACIGRRSRLLWGGLLFVVSTVYAFLMMTQVRA